jgi:DNA-binding XRE family transcriptional regulator
MRRNFQHNPRHQVVGMLLRCLRRSIGLSQAALANELGTTQSHISTWECGWYRPRNLDAVVARLRVLGARIGEDFLNGFPSDPMPWIRVRRSTDANLAPPYGQRPWWDY